MTSPYLLIPPRTLSQSLADATACAVQRLRAQIKARAMIERAA